MEPIPLSPCSSSSSSHSPPLLMNDTPSDDNNTSLYSYKFSAVLQQLSLLGYWLPILNKLSKKQKKNIWNLCYIMKDFQNQQIQWLLLPTNESNNTNNKIIIPEFLILIKKWIENPIEFQSSITIFFSSIGYLVELNILKNDYYFPLTDILVFNKPIQPNNTNTTTTTTTSNTSTSTTPIKTTKQNNFYMDCFNNLNSNKNYQAPHTHKNPIRKRSLSNLQKSTSASTCSSASNSPFSVPTSPFTSPLLIKTYNNNNNNNKLNKNNNNNNNNLTNRPIKNTYYIDNDNYDEFDTNDEFDSDAYDFENDHDEGYDEDDDEEYEEINTQQPIQQSQQNQFLSIPNNPIKKMKKEHLSPNFNSSYDGGVVPIMSDCSGVSSPNLSIHYNECEEEQEEYEIESIDDDLSSSTASLSSFKCLNLASSVNNLPPPPPPPTPSTPIPHPSSLPQSPKQIQVPSSPPPSSTSFHHHHHHQSISSPPTTSTTTTTTFLTNSNITNNKLKHSGNNVIQSIKSLIDGTIKKSSDHIVSSLSYSKGSLINKPNNTNTNTNTTLLNSKKQRLVTSASFDTLSNIPSSSSCSSNTLSLSSSKSFSSSSSSSSSHNLSTSSSLDALAFTASKFGEMDGVIEIQQQEEDEEKQQQHQQQQQQQSFNEIL